MADHFFIMDVVEETYDGSIDYATMTNTRRVHFYDLSQDKDTFFNETQVFFTPFEGAPEPVPDVPVVIPCDFATERNSFYTIGYNIDQVSSSIGQFRSPVSGCTPSVVPLIFGEKTNFSIRRQGIAYRIITK